MFVDVVGWVFVIVMIWMFVVVLVWCWYDIGKFGWWMFFYVILVGGVFIIIVMNGFYCGDDVCNCFGLLLLDVGNNDVSL